MLDEMNQSRILIYLDYDILFDKTSPPGVTKFGVLYFFFILKKKSDNNEIIYSR